MGVTVCPPSSLETASTRLTVLRLWLVELESQSLKLENDVESLFSVDWPAVMLSSRVALTVKAALLCTVAARKLTS